tara:strand:+ start:564 stop:1271 length:708 start_codon:yes stop_codon:yes gene_type:complete
MAITPFKQVPVVLSNGTDASVMNNQVVTLSSSEGIVDIGVAVNGENLQILQTENASSTGSVELTGGGAGSIDTLTVDGVAIIGGAVAFNTSLALTAFDLAVAINAYTSVPNYTATVSGVTVSILADKALAAAPNTFVVASGTTTITTTDVDLAGGTDAEAALIVALENFITIPVLADSGAVYNVNLNVFNIKLLEETSIGSADCLVRYCDDFGVFVNEYIANEDLAAIKVKIAAL